MVDLDEIIKALRSLEVDKENVVRMTTKTRWFYADNFQGAKERLIGKSYKDFSARYGDVKEARRGSDYVEYFGSQPIREENGKKIMTRYYLRQGRYNLFKEKFAFRWSSFTILALICCFFVPVEANLGSSSVSSNMTLDLSDLSSNAVNFAFAVGFVVLLMTVGALS